jgi:hypothetical protein
MNQQSPAALTSLSPRQWLIGILGSWVIVWIVGPGLINSILVRTYEADLKVNTIRPGDVVRWRSEGWASTRIGPHGLPGWQPNRPGGQTNGESASPGGHSPPRIVIWGDSQVEGVCVADEQKIHNQTIAIARRRDRIELDCLPMGRSGANSLDWQDLMPDADRLWRPDLHVWVVTDLSDLTDLASKDAAESYHRWTVESPRWVKFAAAIHAEALFEAGKRIFRDPLTGGIRRLDFSLGPRGATLSSGDANGDSNGDALQNNETLAGAVATAVAELAGRFDGRLAILYAPATPRFAGGLKTDHPDDAAFDALRRRLREAAIPIADVRGDFIELWHTRTELPRGFHNGMPSYGHLNASGNRLVATAIVDLYRSMIRGGVMSDR